MSAARLGLDRDTRRYDQGRLLVGGEPLRALRLTPTGARTLDRLATGRPADGVAERALYRRLVDRGLAHPRPRASERRRDVTVAIPVRDDATRLARCLQAAGDSAPLLVVDDGSVDVAAVSAVCRTRGAQLVRRAQAGGPAAARNTALATVQTDFVAFLDSDCLPQENWLAPLLDHFDDPRVAAAAPRIRPAGADVSRGPRAQFLAARCPLDMGRYPARVQPNGRVSYVPTAALVLRRSALSDGFDEALRYGEDVDLIWRLHDAEWTIRYEPAATVWHTEPRRWRDIATRRFRYGTSAGPLATRHPTRLAPITLRRPALAVAGELRALGLPRRAVAEFAARDTVTTVAHVGRSITMLAPAALLAGLSFPRARTTSVALLAGPPLIEWLGLRPALDPVRWTALAVVDDVAYGAGVWLGALRARTMRPLRPVLRRRRRNTGHQGIDPQSV